MPRGPRLSALARFIGALEHAERVAVLALAQANLGLVLQEVAGPAAVILCHDSRADMSPASAHAASVFVGFGFGALRRPSGIANANPARRLTRAHALQYEVVPL
jgi:hypothetical protein